MKEKREVQIYTCDAPKCRVEAIVPDEELPDGFHGNVTEIGSFGGNHAVWFACRVSHIRAAVEGALNREIDSHRS
jgi:hypothetical protein